VAKKSSTPPPPRRPVQAPKQRTAPREPGGRSRWLLPGIAAAVGVIALAAVLGFVLTRGGGAAVFEEAGCEIETFPSQGREHIEELPEDFEYNSFPPTTGPHNPVTVPWGVYDDPVDQVRLVHNLEHGGLAIQYGDDVAQGDVDALLEWFRGDPNGKVVAPLPELEDRIAVGTWTAPDSAEGTDDAGEGVLMRCPGFDRAAFEEFKSRYGFRGPERFPRELLTPGA
jgi:hypothetical protein